MHDVHVELVAMDVVFMHGFIIHILITVIRDIVEVDAIVPEGQDE